jgi:hypothetical protein
MDGDNKCVPSLLAAQGYTCSCGGRGWSSVLGLSCAPPNQSPCAGDPCLTSLHILNRCENTGSAHFCYCDYPYLPDDKAQTCIAPPATQAPTAAATRIAQEQADADAAAFARGEALACARDNCLTSQDANNRCLFDPQQQQQYTCDCGGEGWATSLDRKRCVRSDGVGCEGDPCNTALEPNNVCSEPLVGAGHTCTCNPFAGWKTPPGAQSCVLEVSASSCSVLLERIGAVTKTRAPQSTLGEATTDSPYVCGASLVQRKAGEFACSEAVDWETATSLCAATGARLCSRAELAKDEAAMTGYLVMPTLQYTNAP